MIFFFSQMMTFRIKKRSSGNNSSNMSMDGFNAKYIFTVWYFTHDVICM